MAFTLRTAPVTSQVTVGVATSAVAVTNGDLVVGWCTWTGTQTVSSVTLDGAAMTVVSPVIRTAGNRSVQFAYGLATSTSTQNVVLTLSAQPTGGRFYAGAFNPGGVTPTFETLDTNSGTGTSISLNHSTLGPNALICSMYHTNDFNYGAQNPTGSSLTWTVVTFDSYDTYNNGGYTLDAGTTGSKTCAFATGAGSAAWIEAVISFNLGTPPPNAQINPTAAPQGMRTAVSGASNF